MFAEHSFTDARSKLTTIVDHVQGMDPQVIRRRKKTEKDVMLITVDQQRELLSYLSFRPEAVTEEDGSITLAFDPMEIYVNQPTVDEAYADLAQEMVDYAQEYMQHRNLYLHSPNRKLHFPYVLRILLCDSTDEVVELLRA